MLHQPTRSRSQSGHDSSQWGEHLDSIDQELAEVGKCLRRLYEALETGKLGLDHLVPRIHELRQRQDSLQVARNEIAERMRGRKQELVDLATVKAYAEDLQGPLSEGSLTGRKTFINSFVKQVIVLPDEAVISYTAGRGRLMPLPPDQVEEDRVLCIVHDGGPLFPKPMPGKTQGPKLS
jgi:hypothetical protein